MTKTTVTTTTTACLIGYARVSTGDQTTDQQVDALRSAGCQEVYIEEAMSGSTTSRPQLDRCLQALEPGDTLVVKRLDRLGRSMPHLVSTVHDLAARGIGFNSLEEGINTATAAGELILHIFASLAQFERRLTIERTRDALQAKKRRGEPLGRRPALTPSMVATARKMVAEGESPSRVAHILRVSRSTIYRSLDHAAL
jgi:DNA invertase Pin-like site-specific DNA recombinase